MAFDGDWARYSTTFTIEGAPSNTDKCLILSMGVTPSATGRAVVTGVQLEPGPVATPFEHRPIGTELALCQRYYQVGGTGLAVTNNSSRLKGAGFAFATRMRANPTITLNSATQDYTFCYSFNDTTSVGDVTNQSTTVAAGTFARADGMARTVLQVGTLGSFAQGNVYMLHTDWLQFYAEL